MFSLTNSKQGNSFVQPAAPHLVSIPTAHSVLICLNCQAYAQLFRRKLVSSKLKVLGHTVSAKSVQVDPAQTSVVKDWPVPQSKHDVQLFHGLVDDSIMSYAQTAVHQCPCKLISFLSASVHGKILSKNSYVTHVYRLKPAEMHGRKSLLSHSLPHCLLVIAHSRHSCVQGSH